MSVSGRMCRSYSSLRTGCRVRLGEEGRVPRRCGKEGGTHGISVMSRASARLPDSKLASNCKDAGGASMGRNSEIQFYHLLGTAAAVR